MEQIEVQIEDIVFRNESNGWTVMQIKAGREHFSAVGIMPFVGAGERVLLSGDWVEHPDYGRQLKVSACESIRPTTLTGVERYLASGMIRGVGPATAKLIVQEFGVKALEILENAPERLTEVDGIGPKRAAMIAESFADQMEMRQTMIFLQTYGIPSSLAVKIFKVFGDRAQDVVRQNPYRLVDEIPGVGFKTADRIAHSLGVEPESEHRLRSGLQYVLNDAASGGGHVFLPKQILIEQATRLLEVDEELVSDSLDRLIFDAKVIETEADGERAVYLPAMYQAEGEVARMLLELNAAVEQGEMADAEARIDRYERDNGVELCREQREGVRTAACCGVTVITGGPGTGKTTSINCIIHLLSRLGEIALTAPTGRAAKRMTETTGCPAKTIHRLLEYGGDEESFQKNQDNQLKVKTVIVDEMSMVDVFLMRNLLRALKPGTRLILVGDADQLPSVGAGNVLRDIIDSGVVPVVRLTEIFRQAGESMIVTNAHRINHGQMPQMNGKNTDFFLERKENAQQVADTIVSLVKQRLPGYMGFDPMRDIQVMAPMKKGDVGVWRLNRLLQEKLNPKRPGVRERVRGEGVFRVGDKVMQVKNNYSTEWERGPERGEGVFNGDMGFITDINPEEQTLTVTFDDDREAVYDDAAQDELELAYCVSVHKSQGSEFPAVVMPVLSGPPMLMTRNLFYTAVTRARKLVVLVGKDACVAQMVRNNHIARRYSALSERLRNLSEIISS